jgi:hypothetical protein
MTWVSVPAATGSSTIDMTATTASDPSGVQYYFDETSGNPGYKQIRSAAYLKNDFISQLLIFKLHHFLIIIFDVFYINSQINMCLAEELRKNKSLNVQGDFGTIIEVGRIELCFLGV